MIKYLKSNKFYSFVLITFGLIVFVLVYCIISCLCMRIDSSAESSVLNSVNVSDSSFTVIIDPGHGGIDGGAVSDNGINEKDLNLDIAMYLRDYLRLSDVRCVMTRTEDVMLSPEYSGSTNNKRADLIARTEFADKYDNSVFVSIHQNKFPVSKYHGMQIFYSRNNPCSADLADVIKKTNRDLLASDNNRESKPAGSEIYILDNLSVPAVLIECGFLSNYVEAEKLRSAEYQKQIAFMIYISLMKYFYNQ